MIRLATSLLLAGQILGLSDKQQEKVCRRGVQAYAEAIADLAAMPVVKMWVSRLPLQDLINERAKGSLRSHLKQVTAMALQRNSRQAVRKLCEVDNNGTLLFRHQPPLIWRYSLLPSENLSGMDWRHRIDLMYAEYLDSLRPDMRRLLSEFRMSDAAFKAVGVGSVGTRCAIGVFVGEQPDDVLVIQSKQAEPSVLAPYIHGVDVCVQGSRCAAAGLHADRASLSNQWAVLPVAALREPAAVMASARRGDKRSRPAPGMPRHHGPVV